MAEGIDQGLLERYQRDLLQTGHVFLANYGAPLPLHPESSSLKISIKVGDEYQLAKAEMDAGQGVPRPGAAPVQQAAAPAAVARPTIEEDEPMEATVPVTERKETEGKTVSDLIDRLPKQESTTAMVLHDATKGGALTIQTPLGERKYEKPQWHAPWKMYRVISGHLGWVHALAVEPGNEWFASGSADRTIKIWDLASGTLKLTLTGHINSVMALAVSQRSPYMFSAGLDKTVKCWDLETNKIIRNYHGHLSGVYSMNLHPTLDVLITGGRDSVARVWDIRTKAQVRILGGHEATVGDIGTQSVDPQIITGSHDSTIRLWDLAEGKVMSVLTHHKKGVRGIAVHPKEFTFASGAADNIKIFKCPEGTFLRNLSGHNTIVNSICVNRDNVLVSGGDNGSLHFWDWKTGYNFQQTQTIAQPGSLDSEHGIFKCTFDQTGSRLLTGEADKTIKMWKEDENATPETHPVTDWKPRKKRRGGY